MCTWVDRACDSFDRFFVAIDLFVEEKKYNVCHLKSIG
jgi:hypothetical protein